MNLFINVIKSIFLGSQVCFRIVITWFWLPRVTSLECFVCGFQLLMLNWEKVCTFFLIGISRLRVSVSETGAFLDLIVHFIASQARRGEALFWLDLIQWEGSVPLWPVKVHKKGTFPLLWSVTPCTVFRRQKWEEKIGVGKLWCWYVERVT